MVFFIVEAVKQLRESFHISWAVCYNTVQQSPSVVRMWCCCLVALLPHLCEVRVHSLTGLLRPKLKAGKNMRRRVTSWGFFTYGKLFCCLLQKTLNMVEDCMHFRGDADVKVYVQGVTIKFPDWWDKMLFPHNIHVIIHFVIRCLHSSGCSSKSSLQSVGCQLHLQTSAL